MPPRRCVLSLTSWFRAPLFGVPEYEVLSRASAFAVRVRSPSFPFRYHFFTSFHVSAPYLFPNYYPKDKFEWLSQLNETNVMHTMEFRDEQTGEILERLGCDSKVYPHFNKDICAVHLNKESEALEVLDEQGFEVEPLPLTLEAGESGAPLRLLGHEQVPRLDPESGNDTSPMIPKTLQGPLLGRRGPHLFVQTSTPSPQGMCGGPVLNERGECVGMVEGLVQPFASKTGQHAVAMQALEQSTCVLDASVIARVIRDVERGNVELPEDCLQELNEESRRVRERVIASE